MPQPQLQELLEAGVHFGHQTRRWNPKMRRFIFAERSGIYIIDLQKTLRQLEAAQELLRNVVLKGEGVLFVCTKKQLKGILEAEAKRCSSFYVTERWLGGTLTNFQTIKKQIKRLKDLEQGAADGDFTNYTKKEQLLFDRERGKLDKNLAVSKTSAGCRVHSSWWTQRKSASPSRRRTSSGFRWWRSSIRTPTPI